MSASRNLKGLLAGVATIACIGTAIAQGNPPTTGGTNAATGAGQQSSQQTPMGTTGTPGANSGTTGSGSTASGSTASGSTSGSTSSNTGAASSGTTGSGASMGSGSTSADTSGTTRSTRTARADRN